MINRAWSTFEIKSFNEEARTFEGIASTPVTDRAGDIVEPQGAKFKLPLPMLWQHGKGAIKDPVGWIVGAKVTGDHISVKGQFAKPKADYPQSLSDELNGAWVRVRDKIVQGLSIGFRAIESEPIKGSLFSERFTAWEWLELSPVSVAANQDATITSVKSADQLLLAASGTKPQVVRLDIHRNLPGASGQPGKTPPMKTTADQIKEFEAQLASDAAKMTAIMTKSGETGTTLNDTEEEEFETLKVNIAKVKKHIERLQDYEQTIVAKAVPVTAANTATVEKASETRGGVVAAKSLAPKGTTFARCVMAMANAGMGGTAGKREAAELAKANWPDSPEVEQILRAAVAAGNTTNTTWAAPLIPAAAQMQSEFLELLRPATIVGRIPGLRRVPFNISIPTQTGGGTYGWVGEGAAKPVSALAFSSVTMAFHKIAGIVVLTKELVKFSNPAAEQIVRDDMVAGIASYIDTQFVDPTVAVNGTVSPASITNGVTPTAASGTTAAAFRTDMKAVMGTFLTVNDDPTKTVVLMSATVAMNLSLLFNTLGQREFPDLSLNGGSILGLPVVISQNVGARIIVLRANEILLADDGPVEIDVSEQASIVMDDAPQASPQTSSLVSLWQRNYVGIRADKFITWKKARSTSVAYISNAAYGG